MLGRREPNLVLRADGEGKRYIATVGWNPRTGGYPVEGEAIPRRVLK